MVKKTCILVQDLTSTLLHSSDVANADLTFADAYQCIQDLPQLPMHKS